jgi:hypothetical protein
MLSSPVLVCPRDAAVAAWSVWIEGLTAGEERQIVEIEYR